MVYILSQSNETITVPITQFDRANVDLLNPEFSFPLIESAYPSKQKFLHKVLNDQHFPLSQIAEKLFAHFPLPSTPSQVFFWSIAFVFLVLLLWLFVHNSNVCSVFFLLSFRFVKLKFIYFTFSLPNAAM